MIHFVLTEKGEKMIIKVALGVVLGFGLLFCVVTLIAAVSAGVMKIHDRINRKEKEK